MIYSKYLNQTPRNGSDNPLEEGGNHCLGTVLLMIGE